MAQRIEDYAVVGDLQTAALVGRDGSIDWLCLPRFDSASCFANLLGDKQAGRWLLGPVGDVRETKRRYRGDTLVLETEFSTDTGVVRLVDAMTPRHGSADIVRVVEGVSGRVEMRMEWIIRFSYGRAIPWVRRVVENDGSHSIVAIAGPDAAVLRGDVLPRRTDARTHEATFAVSAGERRSFAMIWFPSFHDVPPPYDIAEALAATERLWQEWAGHCCYAGPHRDAVIRSLVTLKSLTYQPTGGIVAAPTTSLPEHIGGTRNWDYRYCWLRDATLTLWSLLDAGYREEATAWRGWLLRAIAGDPSDLQIMYGAAGERHLPEFELPWLAGYAGSRPVRIGNAASEQFQLDVYGEVLNALYQARVAGVEENDFSWALQRALLRFLEDAWRRPDRGLWEVRGPDRHFTHSKVMCWVAFDRGVRAVTEHGLSGPADRWAELREEIRAEVLAKAWNADVGAFTQYYGGRGLDAAVLTMPLFGFLPATDERMLATVAAIERELRHGDLVYRYTTSADQGSNVDGLPGEEASFLACSFWLVENFARSGREQEAAELFDRLLALRNDVGLLAEEYDPVAGRMVGNFPQAFSHVALVNAAMTLAGHGSPPHENLPTAG